MGYFGRYRYVGYARSLGLSVISKLAVRMADSFKLLSVIRKVI